MSQGRTISTVPNTICASATNVRRSATENAGEITVVFNDKDGKRFEQDLLIRVVGKTGKTIYAVPKGKPRRFIFKTKSAKD